MRIAALLLPFLTAGSIATAEPVGVVPGTNTDVDAKAAAFVDAIAGVSRRGNLSRWTGRLCPGVTGVRGETARAMLDGLALEARALGVEVGEVGCKPDVVILVTRDPNETIARFQYEHRTFFAASARPDDAEAGPRSAVFDAFLISTAPVRWWHVSRLTATDGRPIEASQLAAGPGIPSEVYRPVTRGTAASRLAGQTSDRLARVLIVVDGRRLEGVSAQALAGYLTMVSLAEIAPAPKPTGFPTILTLFDDLVAGRTPPAGLTAYDRAYLCGLYQAPQDVRTLVAHKGAIRRRVAEAAAGDERPCPAAKG